MSEIHLGKSVSRRRIDHWLSVSLRRRSSNASTFTISQPEVILTDPESHIKQLDYVSVPEASSLSISAFL